MASRRVRIKGIANIPQRKKTNNVPNNENKDETNPQAVKSENSQDEPNLTLEERSHVELGTAVVKGEDDENNIDTTANNISNDVNIALQNELKCDTNNTKCDAFNNNNSELKNEEKKEPSSLPIRRKFIKPTIAVNAINRKKEKTENGIVEPNKENVKEVVNILNETTIAPSMPHLPPQVSLSSNNTTPGPISVKIAPSFVQKDISKCGSDTEYPPPPVSPSKILNRRIKAVPRLHQRRTSFSVGSASESEDDSRRTNIGRVRNDSICSVASVATDPQTSATKEAVSSPRKETTANPPRKFRRSEQGRKIAEARRHFYQKFADGKPDKQKLTMMDLIYYNPATNPMNPRKRRETTSTVIEEVQTPTPSNKSDEEAIDDPNQNSDEDEDGVLAPQIKVGPNGEIVIDEKSLVIENLETKKSRQALEKAEVIDGDFDTSYGIYKRVKRTKDWHHEETLRFYKALNTIGTDFTMMCELFPNRTRRELKLKFKREEKINRALIDRAVMQPVEFDMNELRKDLEEHQRYVEEKVKRVEEVKMVKEKERQKRLGRKSRKKSLVRVDGMEDDEDFPEEVSKEGKPKRKRRRKQPYDCVKKGITALLDDTDSDEEYKPAVIDKRTETRRVAIPREAKKTDKSVDENAKNNQKAKNLEPGSLMIIPSSESGKTAYKVFMVTDEAKNETQTHKTTEESTGKIVSVQDIITISENVIDDPQTFNHNKDMEISEKKRLNLGEGSNSSNNSNITISHDDNQMTIVTEC